MKIFINIIKSYGLKKLINLGTICALAVELVCHYIYLTEFQYCDTRFFDKIYYLMPYVFFLISIYRIIESWFLDKRTSIFLGILLLGCMAYMHFNEYSSYNFLFILTMAMSLYGISFTKIMLVYTIEKAVLFFLTILAAVIGFLPNDPVMWHGRELILWGFGFHNAFMITVMFTLLGWIYLIRKKELLFFEAIIIGILTYVAYKISISRTSTIAMCIVIAGMLLMSFFNLPKMSKIKKKIMPMMGIIMILTPVYAIMFSIVGALRFNYLSFINHVDYAVIRDYTYNENTFYSRFRDISINLVANGFKMPWMCEGLEEIAIKDRSKYSLIFGGKMASFANDNLFATMFTLCGIITFILMLFWMFYRAYVAYKTEDYMLLIIFTALIVFDVMEAAGMKFDYSPFILMPFTVWRIDRDDSFEWLNCRFNE